MTRSFERHHRLPRSRGGTNEDANISNVEVRLHRAWHKLFGAATAPEVAAIITDIWCDPDYYLVAIPRNKKQSSARRKRYFCTTCNAEVLKHLPVTKGEDNDT